MVFGKIKEIVDRKKEERAEKAKRREEYRERMFSEKEEVELLFDGLSDKGKNLCLKLLAKTKYVLARSSISMDDKGELAKLRRVVSIITYWHPLDRRELLTKLCTKYNIEQTFSESQRDAEDEDEEFEIMCEELAIDKEKKRRIKEEKKKERQRRKEERGKKK